MEKRNVPTGKRFRSVNFQERSEAATRDNEKWKVRGETSDQGLKIRDINKSVEHQRVNI